MLSHPGFVLDVIRKAAKAVQKSLNPDAGDKGMTTPQAVSNARFFLHEGAECWPINLKQRNRMKTTPEQNKKLSWKRLTLFNKRDLRSG